MPQVLKEEIRQRILQAAAETFAAEGFEGATIAKVAARAGLGGATLYRYYEGKEQLFDAVVPPSLARAFSTLLEARVRTLGARFGLGEHGDAEAREEELLRFWIEHRLAVVILLDRAQGTRYARFGARFVDTLVELTEAQLVAARPGLALDAPTRFVLRRIFENTRGMLASILEQHARERDVRVAIEAFWSYQLAGLRGFTERLAGETVSLTAPAAPAAARR
jgi:AcrR family transcriptional regulator